MTLQNSTSRSEIGPGRYQTVELYVQVFDEEDALDRLEAFASLNGPPSTGCP